MNTKVDQKSAGWSLRPAAAVGESPAGLSDVPCSVAHTLSGESRAGWDPYEVWLRRIDQPRRRRTDVVSSPD